MTLPDYVTLSDIADKLPDNSVSTGVSYDVLVSSLITRCSRQFDRMTNRKPGAYAVTADTTRYFDGPLCHEPTVLPVGELAALPTSVSVAETGVIDRASGSGVYTLWAATNYYATPHNAADNGRPYEYLVVDQLNGTYSMWLSFPRGIKIVGKFGYSATVPEDIKDAVCNMVVRMLRKAQQNYVNVASINDIGQVMQGDKLDDDIMATVYQYKVMAI